MPFLLDGIADRREIFQPDRLHPAAEAQPLMLDNVWKGLEPLLHEAAQQRAERVSVAMRSHR